MDDKTPDKSTLEDKWDDLRKRTKLIYSVNGSHKAQLIHSTDGGWICHVWRILEDGNFRPLIRNIKPFPTFEEALEMAQSCFTTYTGDDGTLLKKIF